METVQCDLCGADRPLPYVTTTDRFSGKVFTLSICSNCNLIYLNPRPTQDEVYKYYPEEYEAYVFQAQNQPRRIARDAQNALQMQLDYVEKFHPERGRLLDVGCATGNFLNFARGHGWSVFGIEINEKAAKSAREEFGLSVFTTIIENIELPESSIDVVTLWDVLEHLPSPKSALQVIHKLLKPGGMIFFSIPNLVSFDRKLFKANWIGWDAPRHFNLFNSETINKLLNETGFNLLDQRCLLGGKGTFWLSMKRVIQEKQTLGWLETVYPIMSLLLWPYRKISYRMLKGPIMNYAIQKE